MMHHAAHVISQVYSFVQGNMRLDVSGIQSVVYLAIIIAQHPNAQSDRRYLLKGYYKITYSIKAALSNIFIEIYSLMLIFLK